MVDIQGYQLKLEGLETNALTILKENLKPAYWSSNLRAPLPLKRCLNGKFVEKIEREGLSLRAACKFDREYSWMKERDFNVFEALDGKVKFAKKLDDLSEAEHFDSGSISRNKSSVIGVPCWALFTSNYLILSKLLKVFSIATCSMIF
jgi:hypothetical protein